jgi:transcriptional regulator with XRE-family HTH domain
VPANRAPSQAARAAAFGARVRQLRRAAHLTQRQLAERIPMSAGNLSRIENGEQGPPSDEVIHGLATSLTIEPDELFAVAGRRLDPSAELVLRELRQLRAELKAGFARLEAVLEARG